MDLNRRGFLNLSGAGLVGAVALSAMPDTKALAAKKFPLPYRGKETQTICCYCSVGRGAIVTAWGEEGKERSIDWTEWVRSVVGNWTTKSAIFCPR